MKERLVKLVIIAFFSLSGCSKDNQSSVNSYANKTEEHHSSDTLYVNKETSLAIIPTLDDNKINKIKKKHSEENFYTIADDQNYYQNKAINFLKIKGIKVISLNKRYMSFTEDKYLIDNNSLPAWDIVLYQTGKKPKVIKPIDIAQDYEEYFEKQTNKKENGQWQGEYLLNIEENYYDGNIYKVQAKLNIFSKDSTVFSMSGPSGNKLTILGEFKLNKAKDSLSLYTSKIYKNSSNLTLPSPILTLFKKDSVYYIASPIIYVSRIPGHETEIKKY